MIQTAYKKLHADCVNKADVVFLLDSSGSIDAPYFQHIVNFVSQMVDSFDIDGGNIRVGVVSFSDDVQPAFNLNEYSTRQAVQVILLQLIFSFGVCPKAEIQSGQNV